VQSKDDERSAGPDRPFAYGLDHPPGGAPRVVAKLGDQALDLAWLQRNGQLHSGPSAHGVFSEPSLNRFMALGKAACQAIGEELTQIASSGPPEPSIVPLSSTRLVLPVDVADFCDFYASEHHASNMGRILRPGSDPLPAAWRRIPLGYHGRAGTVVVSGTPVRRPVGVVQTPNGPERCESARLDLEVELGYVVGTPSKQGDPVAVVEALDHIFGVVVVNDWSARDIQSFEYQPLGPFLGKSFATSMSAWVVPVWALESFRVKGPPQGAEVSPNLYCNQPRALDVHFELSIDSTVISRPEGRYVHWSVEQMVAHLTSNGASLRTGDLLATGTISGPDKSTWGSLMELAWAGDDPVHLDDGRVRTWLEDGDQVTIRAWCGDDAETRVDFGEVAGEIHRSEPVPGDDPRTRPQQD